MLIEYRSHILIKNFQEMLRPISGVATQQQHTSKNLQVSQETPPFRGSHQWCSIKKLLFKNVTIFTGKHMSESLFKKDATLLKKRLEQRCFPVNIATFL